jgi:hypothetical protein
MEKALPQLSSQTIAFFANLLLVQHTQGNINFCLIKGKELIPPLSQAAAEQL